MDNISVEYVPVTPARNEAALIEPTNHSGIVQPHLFRRWMIVKGGATVGTGEIVLNYMARRDCSIGARYDGFAGAFPRWLTSPLASKDSFYLDISGAG